MYHNFVMYPQNTGSSLVMYDEGCKAGGGSKVNNGILLLLLHHCDDSRLGVGNWAKYGPEEICDALCHLSVANFDNAHK